MEKSINRVEVPVTETEDVNVGLTRWRDGKCVSLDEGTHVTFYIGHESEHRINEEGEERMITTAFPVRVAKPASRDMAINAAEMSAYGLRSAMEVASFNASLARKSRIAPEDIEVKEHDDFIGWVKEQLTAIGV